MPLETEFPLRGSVPVKTIRDLYCPDLDGSPEWTIDEMIRRRLSEQTIGPGTTLQTQDLAFHVRELDRDGRITRVGMVICPRNSKDGCNDSKETAAEPQQTAAEPEKTAAEPEKTSTPAASEIGGAKGTTELS